ncbi:hypothetical protein HK101_005990, partial [Irineochytrium annulatum]
MSENQRSSLKSKKMDGGEKPATFSYAAAAAAAASSTSKSATTSQPPPSSSSLQPPKAPSPITRRKSAPDTTLRVPLADAPSPASSAGDEGGKEDQGGRGNQPAQPSGSSSRATSPTPQKVWANSKLPHKKSGESVATAATSAIQNQQQPLNAPAIAIIAAASDEHSWKAV